MSQESAFVSDPDEHARILQLTREPWAGTRWAVDIYICANPSCNCTNVQLECIREGSSRAGHKKRFCFWLDVEKRELFRGGDPMPSQESLAFGAAVAAELGDADWLFLSDYLCDAKERGLRRPTGKPGEFPEEVVSGEVTMAGYAEIFPDANPIGFKFESADWLADDQYCINPRCRCREALLSFISLPALKASGNIADGPAAFFDYKRSRFEAAHEPADQPPLAQLFRALRQAQPDLNELLGRRHLEMKTPWREALHQKTGMEPEHTGFEIPSGSPSPTQARSAQSAKIGRNDPCMCGSGKKYKKCCGK